jgi:hypothetical protein
LALTDDQIHSWIEDPDSENTSLFSDEEIEKLLTALILHNPEIEVGVEESKAFLDWAVRQSVGEALVSGTMKGVMVPCLDPDDPLDMSKLGWLPHPDLDAERVSDVCVDCGRDRHGYRKPRCRYCDGTAE